MTPEEAQIKIQSFLDTFRGPLERQDSVFNDAADTFIGLTPAQKQQIGHILNIGDNEIINLNKYSFIYKWLQKERQDLIDDVYSNLFPQDEDNQEILYLGIQKKLRVSSDTLLRLSLGVNQEDGGITEGELSYDGFGPQRTSGLYWLWPEKYIPTDKHSIKLLEILGVDFDGVGIDATRWNYTQYINVINQLKTILNILEGNGFIAGWVIAFSHIARALNNNVVDNILKRHTTGDNLSNKNIILTGIPGTGKTHSVKEFMDRELDEDRTEFIQFHPSYDYEDFIEGLKPIPNIEGGISFQLVNGPFKKLCKNAYHDNEHQYLMVIDEINRANLSSVFGELLYCLEYRDEFISTKMTGYIQNLADDEQQNQLSITNEDGNIGKFCIPSNVLIIGTMNEIDRSIDAFDLALRRRFIWHDIGFDEQILLYKLHDIVGIENIKTITLKAKKLNKKLEKEIGHNYQVGHTYFFKITEFFDPNENNIDDAFESLWEYHLRSLLQEYCKTKFSDDDIVKKLEDYKNIITGDS